MGIQNFYLYKDNLIIELDSRDGCNIKDLERFINRNESRIKYVAIRNCDTLTNKTLNDRLKIIELLEIYELV